MSVHSADVARSWLEQAAALGSPAAAAVVLVRRARLAVAEPPPPHSDPLAAAAGAASAGRCGRRRCRSRRVWARRSSRRNGKCRHGRRRRRCPIMSCSGSATAPGERWVSTDGARRLGQRRATISSLQPGAAYWVRVRAAARDGRLSEFSQSVAPALTAPPAPEAFPIDGGVVHVIFGAAECAAHHELAVATARAGGPARRCRVGGQRGQRAALGDDGGEAQPRGRRALAVPRARVHR